MAQRFFPFPVGHSGDAPGTLIQSFSFYFRFEPNPESGTSKGLTLMLDAKTHLITASSITDYAQELKWLICQYETILIETFCDVGI